MRFLVLGAGSIGQRHCRNLAALGHEVLAWDVDPARLAEVPAAAGGATPVRALEHGLDAKPDAAIVCTPPASHLGLARRALAAGAHLFIEKPISHSTEGVEALLEDARAADRRVMVGFNLRFLRSLNRVRELLDEKRIGEVLSVRAEFGGYLPDWRPERDYRENYAVRADQGGGILLDAIHELDYLGWLFGDVDVVSCAAQHRSSLAGDTEDLVEATLRFESDLLAQVHLDYFQRVYRRNLQVIGEGGTLLWDYPTHSVALLQPGESPERMDFAAEESDANTMYAAEIEHFIGCVKTGRSPRVDGWEALRSLRVVEAARRSAQERRWEAV